MHWALVPVLLNKKCVLEKTQNPPTSMVEEAMAANLHSQPLYNQPCPLEQHGKYHQQPDNSCAISLIQTPVQDVAYPSANEEHTVAVTYFIKKITVSLIRTRANRNRRSLSLLFPHHSPTTSYLSVYIFIKT